MMQKFKRAIKKEFLYFLLTLIILTLILHIDILSDPAARFSLMLEKENYFHPIFYSSIVYGALFILRKAIDFIVGLFEKKPQ